MKSYDATANLVHTTCFCVRKGHKERISVPHVLIALVQNHLVVHLKTASREGRSSSLSDNVGETSAAEAVMF